ncbi:MAG: alpha/beta fold hydrolase [Acidimicrobiales bacterium]
MSNLRVSGKGGLEMAVHDLGGEGPALLLAHATGFCGAVFGPLAGHLTGRFHSWAIDFRGHGDSGMAPDGNMSWAALADDVLAVVGELGLHGLYGFGHSMGAAVLLDAEARRPGTFAGLWCFEPILGPAPLPSEVGDALVAAALRRQRTFASRADALAHLSSRSLFRNVDPVALAAYVDGGFDLAVDGSVSLKCTPETEAAAFRAGITHDGFERLARVACPVWFGRGENTTAADDGQLRVLAGSVADGRVQVLGGMGHLGPLEAPATVAEVVHHAVAPRR